MGNKFSIDGIDQVTALRRQVRDHESTIKKLREQLGNHQEFAESVCAAVVAADPLPVFKYASPKSSNPVVACIKFSDWHIGEVIESSEVEGFNTYNWQVAQERITGIVQAFLGWVDVQRAAYRIDKCVIFGEGDYISGDIHGELLATNEFPMPVQTAKAGTLLGEMFRIICGHFKEVEVLLVGADNHGRLQKKPQAKQKTSNNMSYLVHEMALAYAARCSNLKPFVSTGAKLLHAVNGQKFLIEHGDTVRGWAGLPFYGFSRVVGRESTRRMNTDKGFDYWSIGHFHVPNFIENRILVNGSLSGTSEFDHLCGRHAKPAQVAFLVHQKHGIFNLVPFHG